MTILPTAATISDEVRAGVVKSMPIIDAIEDSSLRSKVIEAWALSLVLNGYESVDEIPGSGMPGVPAKGTQGDHAVGVAKIAVAIKESLEEVLGDPIPVSRDILIAAAVCHDVGKPIEYSSKNRARWDADPKESGRPSLRHTAYGVYIAITVGLPESVVHVCGYHSPEGRLVERSLAATIVQHADDSYWFTLESALAWEKLPRL